jgi:hypothetical protein
MRLWWVALLVVAVPLTGCVSAPRDNVIQADPDAGNTACLESACASPSSAPSGTGHGESAASNSPAASPPPPPRVHHLEILVRDLDTGEPQAKAPVVLLDYSGNVVGTQYLVYHDERGTYSPRVQARTDAAGVARFDVPPGILLAFAATAPGSTTEVLAGVLAGADQDTTRYEIGLLDAVRVVDVDRTLAVPGNVALPDDTQVDSFELHFAANASLDARYYERVRGIKANVTWTNDAQGMAWGDLYTTMGPTDDARKWVSSNTDDTTQSGTRQESLAVGWEEYWDSQEKAAWTDLDMHTWTPSFEGRIPGGLDVHHSVTVSFRGSNYLIQDQTPSA